MRGKSGKPAHPPTQGATAPNRTFTTQAHAIGDKRYHVEVLDDPFWEDEPDNTPAFMFVGEKVFALLGGIFVGCVLSLLIADAFINDAIVQITADAILITVDF